MTLGVQKALLSTAAGGSACTVGHELQDHYSGPMGSGTLQLLRAKLCGSGEEQPAPPSLRMPKPRFAGRSQQPHRTGRGHMAQVLHGGWQPPHATQVSQLTPCQQTLSYPHHESNPNGLSCATP